MNPPIKSGAELDWVMVEKAAKGILKAAEKAGFRAPEDVQSHMIQINEVCKAMNAIQDALKLRRKNKHEMLAPIASSLFDSAHAYNEGYSKARCSCGWVSSDIRERDCATAHQTHVQQEMHQALVDAANHGKALADG